MDPIEIIYDEIRLELLKDLRKEAIELQSRINERSFVYGSLARGDVHPGSDIDIIIPDQVEPFDIEYRLGIGEGIPCEREIVQATPNHVIKGHIHLNRYTTITFPLVSLSSVEDDFYRFSGVCTREDLENSKRVPGVDKRLVLIEPTPSGHIEYSINDRKKKVSRILGIGMDIIEERTRVLTRRTKHGRTGVSLKELLSEDESFGMKLRYLADRNYIVRKQLKQRGGPI